MNAKEYWESISDSKDELLVALQLLLVLFAFEAGMVVSASCILQ